MTDESAAALDLAGSDHGSTIHIGRYALHRPIARGGMATIHIARLMGDEGFSRIVAAKRLLPEFAEDAEFVTMLLDEARIASRIHHRNVVPVLDVVTTGSEAVLVQEYVHGAPLHWLLNRARQAKVLVPIDIAVAIACQILAGLHAAHETTDELGAPLGVVHRDVSPQNVMIAIDGTARLLDFGVAKSLMAAHVTREGTYKGKLAYSAPEQLRGAAVRQSDIYSLTVLLWELLAGHRMHRTAQAEAELVATIMSGKLPSMAEALVAQGEWEAFSDEHRQQLQALEPIIKRGLAAEIQDRFQTAAEMEEALVAVVRPASGSAVAQWLRSLGKEYMDKHEKVLAAEEASWRRTVGPQPGERRAQQPTVPLRVGSPRPGSGPRPDESSSSASLLPSPSPSASQSQSASPRPTPSTPHALPMAPQHRAPYALVALLSLLVVALAIGIIIVVRGQTEPAPSLAAPAPTASPVAPQPAAPAPAAAAKPAAPPAAATAGTSAPASALSISEVETSPTPAETAPRSPAVRPRPTPSRSAVRLSAPLLRPGSGATRPKDSAPEPEPAPAPAPAPAPEAKEACNPPYYFEGTKKIFKPACL